MSKENRATQTTSNTLSFWHVRGDHKVEQRQISSKVAEELKELSQLRSNKRAFTLQTFKALKKIEDKIIQVYTEMYLDTEENKDGKIVLTFKRPFSGRSVQLQIGKFDFFYSRNLFFIVENKINE